MRGWHLFYDEKDPLGYNLSETAKANGNANAAAALLVISSVKILVIRNKAARMM